MASRQVKQQIAWANTTHPKSWLQRQSRSGSLLPTIISPSTCCDTTSDVAMMYRALELAAQAESIDEVPVGALIHLDGQIIAEAHNMRESASDPTAHAELIAIQQAAELLGDWRLNGCTLVVTLEPCPMCAGAIVNARVSRLVYGTPDPKMGAVHTLYNICSDRRLNHRLAITRGTLAPQCSQILTNYFKKRRLKHKQ